MLTQRNWCGSDSIHRVPEHPGHGTTTALTLGQGSPRHRVVGERTTAHELRVDLLARLERRHTRSMQGAQPRRRRCSRPRGRPGWPLPRVRPARPRCAKARAPPPASTSPSDLPASLATKGRSALGVGASTVVTCQASSSWDQATTWSAEGLPPTRTTSAPGADTGADPRLEPLGWCPPAATATTTSAWRMAAADQSWASLTPAWSASTAPSAAPGRGPLQPFQPGHVDLARDRDPEPAGESATSSHRLPRRRALRGAGPPRRR